MYLHEYSLFFTNVLKSGQGLADVKVKRGSKMVDLEVERDGLDRFIIVNCFNEC